MAGVAACNQAGWDDQDDTDLVGRGAELTALLGLVDRVAAGTGQRAVIEGEVGVGKTRLVTEVLARAGAAGLHLFAEPPAGAGSLRAGVVVVEDLHALDPAALAGLGRLAATLRNQPVLLLLTARLVPRSPELTELLAGLQGLGALLVRLGGLETDDVAVLAQRRLGSAPSGRLRRV